MTDRHIGNGTFMMGDCLERMGEIPEGSVDMILCDLPYGTTQNKWDAVIPVKPLWSEYWRVAKPGAAVVLTAAQPFTSVLVMSQVEQFRQELVWCKNVASDFLNAKRRHMAKHESVLLFCKAAPPYHPQASPGTPYIVKRRGKDDTGDNYGNVSKRTDTINDGSRLPTSILEFPVQKGLHPTQKPVALFEYLIRTYTDEGMTVLDNCAGSGTTAIAAERTGRKWICIERDENYFTKACERVRAEVESKGLFA
jgi:site-specific DNA-methyltransferase (adenine-specific)